MSSIMSILSDGNSSSEVIPSHGQKERNLDELDKTQQRKRSKVSRACDECRRKKIKCDATFTIHSNTLEKSCTSCTKNNYVCSFERVPLKRGPTKGYSKVDPIPIKNRSRNSSIEHSQQQSPITLPPLTSITNNFQSNSSHLQHHNNSQINQPASPRKLSIDKLHQTKNVVNPNPIITQSQFWKVPHDAPFNRRGSVDSISSSISENRFGNNQFPLRTSNSSVISDSDDELKSITSPRDFRERSRSNSQSLNHSIPTSPASSFHQTQTFQPPRVNTNHLIESYYRFIHPNLPILSLNNQSLITILSKPPQILQNEFDDLNHFIIQNFFNSLDLLISIVSKNISTTNSSRNLNNLNKNNQFLESLNFSFINLSKFFNRIIIDFDKFEKQAIILFLSTLVILSYGIILLGDQTDVLVINSSLLLFNRLKIYKLFWNSDLNENFDDYHFQLKRLWTSLNYLYSLHCLSHGLPNTMNFKIDLIEIDRNFPNLKSFNVMKDNLKLGLLFTDILRYSDFNNNDKNIIRFNFFLKDLKSNPNFTTVNKLFNNDENSLSIKFFEFILNKFELLDFLQDIRNHEQQIGNENFYDEDLLIDYQFKLLRMIKKQLTIQSEIFKTIKNNTNSIDNDINNTLDNNSIIISPLLPLIFKQSIKNLNVLKILINSLQFNESLVPRLSKLLNELIKLTNILSLIKPFIDNDLNNHLNFKFNSKFLEIWENLDSNIDDSDLNQRKINIHKTWYGLMNDVLKYGKIEDFEGWF